LNKIKLQLVHYMPNDLQPGILYVSQEFNIAIHLCACGCGSKIKTPLGYTDWTLKIINNHPSLYPSIGNWQQSCQSHYFIRNGNIVWCKKWTQEQIDTGRQKEKAKSILFYNNLYKRQSGFIHRLLNRLINMFKREQLNCLNK
jgi:hypothetical protein